MYLEVKKKKLSVSNLLIKGLWLDRYYFNISKLIFISASNNSSDQRIVGGTAATAGEFPYQGLLLSSDGLCGCVLIQTTWALTAAHCTDG